MNRKVSLLDVKPGERARVRGLGMSGGIRQRLLDIGLMEGTIVECLGKSPGGDPSAYRIRGAVIALRAEDAKNVWIEA